MSGITKELSLSEHMVELTDAELDAVTGGIIVARLRPEFIQTFPVAEEALKAACQNFEHSSGQGHGPPFCRD